MSYEEWYKLHHVHRQYHPSEFDELPCPKCSRVAVVSLISANVGRARWCRSCKLLFNRDGILLDVLTEHEREWLDEQE